MLKQQHELDELLAKKQELNVGNEMLSQTL